MIEAQDRFPGCFVAWCENALGISKSKAYRLIADVRAFTADQFPTVGNLPVNTRDRLAHLDQPVRDEIVEELKDGKLTRQDAPARIQEERVRQAPKTGRGHSRPAAATVVRMDAACDRKKLRTFAEQLLAILRDDLAPERFDKFKNLYLISPRRFEALVRLV